MPILRKHLIKRQDLRRHPSWLFAFGDNVAGKGLGGQAKEMRGEPNAVGIPTKHAPSRQRNAYLSDADLPKVQALIDGAFARLEHHLAGGGTVVLPTAGFGSGLADLERRAPRVWTYIQERIDGLERMYGTAASSEDAEEGSQQRPAAAARGALVNSASRSAPGSTRRSGRS